MSKQILVVEDEIIIADEISLILQKEGYEVLEPALSYSEAVNSFDLHFPDLVILDVQLSGQKTGLNVAEHIRKKSSLPLLFLTACGDPKSMAEIAGFEPLACIDKVFFKDQLIEKVDLVYSSSQSPVNTLLVSLTKSEKAVLTLVSKGLTTRDIALQLGASPSTIKNHRHSICRKLSLPIQTNALLNWVLGNESVIHSSS